MQTNENAIGYTIIRFGQDTLAIPTPATTISRAALPAIGARFGEDVFVGIARSDADDIAIFLNIANAPILPWVNALQWAAALATEHHPAGTYSLPTRKEQALLFANAAEHFEPAWYWSSEEASADFAWMKYFYHGHQGNARKDLGYRVRAVRRLVIH
jgi:hypothetical protein